MIFIKPLGVLSVLGGKNISSLRAQVASLFLQNEPNFSFKIKLVSLFIIKYYNNLTRFSDWVRFYKRTQLIKDSRTLKLTTAKRSWQFYSCAFEALRFFKRTQSVVKSPRRQSCDKMPAFAYNASYGLRRYAFTCIYGQNRLKAQPNKQ